MKGQDDELLPGSVVVPFAEIDAAVARMTGIRRGRRGSGRALTATLVAVGARADLIPAARAIAELADPGAVRAILISTGSNAAPAARVSAHAIAIEDLKPAYVNNAVAALRLSSLPLVVWWRGGAIETLRALADLADRVLLDTDDAAAVWPHVIPLFEQTAVTDLRWTRLTRWRALMAHFFDVTQVQQAAGRFNTLRLAGSDRATLTLFAGWLDAALGWNGRVKPTIEIAGVTPIASVQLGDGREHLALQLAASGSCVESTARLSNHDMSQTVSLGDQGLAALVASELRVRSRDLAFEQALRASGAAA